MVTLRSTFTPGTTRWAVRRSQWRALGLTDEDMQRPKIAVVNSSSTLSSCYIHLDALSREVQDAIRAAGGVPFEIRTVAPSDFVTSAGRSARYLMPSRDLLVNDVEVMVEGALLDGMVCLSSCDKTTPAHLMAAARLDLPTVLVIGGYQAAGSCAGRVVDIDDVYESVGAVAAGAMDVAGLCALTEHAITSPGVCAGLGTANTMHVVAEALGMTPPGSAPVRAGSPGMHRRAAEAGGLVLDLVAADLRPRAILTPAAIRNAVTVVQAIGGSVNAVRHLAAVATEAGLSMDVVREFELAAGTTPLLTAIRPNGVSRVPDLERAGGARAIMGRLAGILDTTVLTVTGRPLADQLRPGEPAATDVIRTVDAPLTARGGLDVLRGNLAPAGAIVKVAAVRDRTAFRGPVRLYEDEEAAIEALAQGRIKAGDVVVMHGLGPRGGPGTVFAAGFVAALVGAGLAHHVAVVTDGELSGLNSGFVVGQVMPEAAAGGPLGAVRDGDVVAIDLDRRRVDLVIDGRPATPDEIATRLAAAPPRVSPAPRGWLGLYRQAVQPIETTGATLVPPAVGTGA